MLRASEIPSNYYLPAKTLAQMGMSYSELKGASQTGGVLYRWRSKKTRRVYYRSRNLELL